MSSGLEQQWHKKAIGGGEDDRSLFCYSPHSCPTGSVNLSTDKDNLPEITPPGEAATIDGEHVDAVADQKEVDDITVHKEVDASSVLADLPDVVPDGYVLMRWVYLRCFALVHFTAFLSYAVQLLALNGAQGVVPTIELLNEAAVQLGPDCVFYLPTLAWLDGSDQFLLCIAYGGVIASLFVLAGILTGPFLILLAVLWLSLVNGGGEFTGFQSDGMLVEATFLTLFFAPWQFFEPHLPVPLRWRRQIAPPLVAIWLLRFLLFRLMFAAGAVKLLSGDPTWADLTALQYHFETQPIPTPLAWYVHQLPPPVLKFGVIATLVSELVAPVLIFTTRNLRYVAAVLMSALHVMILLTGNYTFLNWLAICLCIPVLDDRPFMRILPSSLQKRILESQREPASNMVRRNLIAGAACFPLLFMAIGQFLISIGGRGVIPQFVREMIVAGSSFHLADRYGMFAVMTTKRPEVVFEGSNDGKHWSAYEFKYKVDDDLKKAPPVVAPHMPRLTWRLWFAAMGPLEDSKWVLGLAMRILEGSRIIKGFFSYDPFPNDPPKYIRAFVYDYHFTNWDEKNKTGNWWWRDNKRVFLPPIMLVDGRPAPADLLP